MIFICFLIALLIILIFYTIYKYLTKKKIIEGVENNNKFQNYNKQDKTAYMLAQKNAANISSLKDKFDDILKFKKQMSSLSTDVQANKENINQIITQQTKKGKKLSGGRSPGDTPPQIGGAS